MLVMVRPESLRLVLYLRDVVRHRVPGSSGKFRRRLNASRVPRVQEHKIFHTDENKGAVRPRLMKQDGGVHELGVGAVAVHARLDRRDVQQFRVDMGLWVCFRAGREEITRVSVRTICAGQVAP